ncbi:MAG: hypothetical protein ACKOAD_04665, partial [Gammaproteobacteria bacterium]
DQIVQYNQISCLKTHFSGVSGSSPCQHRSKNFFLEFPHKKWQPHLMISNKYIDSNCIFIDSNNKEYIGLLNDSFGFKVNNSVNYFENINVLYCCMKFGGERSIVQSFRDKNNLKRFNRILSKNKNKIFSGWFENVYLEKSIWNFENRSFDFLIDKLKIKVPVGSESKSFSPISYIPGSSAERMALAA